MSKAETRNCQNCKSEFTIEPDDFTFYEKVQVPAPKLCPRCRYLRRLLDRNEWSLYKRKCNFTGDTIISIYRNDAPFPVYKQEIWRSDKFDPLSYSRNFDFNRPFFEQYEELRLAVPHLALVNSNSVNSEYSNQSQNNKDCYMVSATGNSEKCLYGNWYQYSSFSVDCSNVWRGELCYESIDCVRSSSCRWSQDCYDCVAVDFCIDCRGCTNCFGCVNLRNKKYHWFNEPLTKDEYEKRLRDFDWSRSEITKAVTRVRELARALPKKFFHGQKAFDSSGDYIENVQSSRENFNGKDNKDTAYLQDFGEGKDCLDCTEILKAEHSYELQGCAFINRSMVLRSSWTITDCYYCDMCFSCADCFGCFGLKQGQYCILNKQYLKEQYLELKKRIIEHMKKTGEWGEYFPAQHSPFAYNESVAQIYFPLTKKEAEERGYSWHEAEEKTYRPTLNAKDLPEKISETDDSIVNEVIRCSSQDAIECVTAFRIVPLELMLYQKLGVPVPSKCFPCRRQNRFNLRNPRQLWHRKCACAGSGSENDIYKNTISHFHGSEHCPNEFETSYAPERPEIIYCEQCYQQEVV